MKICYILNKNEDCLLYAYVDTTSTLHGSAAGAECDTSGNALKNNKLHFSYLH
jgi:hypothetical protein